MSTNTKKSKSSEETLEKLRAFINEKGGIVKKEEFAALDVDYRKILEFVEAGTLVRIKNGYYTDRIDRFSEEELIARLFPDARLCMESALYALWIYPGKSLTDGAWRWINCGRWSCWLCQQGLGFQLI